MLVQNLAAFSDTNLFDVWFPSCVSLFVRVAHVVAELNAFPAYIAFSHKILRLKNSCRHLLNKGFLLQQFFIVERTREMNEIHFRESDDNTLFS
jgi:hypothetical protein